MTTRSYSILFLAFWLTFCFGFDLGSDEAHYILYSQNLDWSYFDHPPLIGWIHFIFQSIFGLSNFSARLPSLLLSIWTFFEVKRLGLFQRPDLPFGFQLTLVPFLMSIFLLPDTPLIPISLALHRVTLQLLKVANIKSWIHLGVLLGLAGLSKYSAALLVLPIAYCFLFHYKFTLFKHKGLYAAMVIALSIILPVLIWNFQNDFISFKYQFHHVVGQTNGLENFLSSTLMQWIGYGIILSPMIAWTILKIYFGERKNRRNLFLSDKLQFFIPFVWTLFFMFSSFSKVTLPHWTLVAWLFWVLFTSQHLCPKWLRYQNLISIALLFILTCILWLPISFQHLINLNEVMGWKALMDRISKELTPHEILYISNWSYGSRANLYAPPHLKRRIQIADTRKDQFDLWEKKNQLNNNMPGKLVVFKGDTFNLSNIPLNCQIFKEGLSVSDEHFQKWKHEFMIYQCH